MIPTTQTILHDPENGINGNCLSAVLASLLHVDIADVPVFCDEVSWVKDLNAWLRQFGLAYVQCKNFQEQCEASGIEGCYCEVFGDSPRSPGTLHATVGVDGVMVFDPHPDRAGVVGDPVCGLFVALQPWRMGREKAGGGNVNTSRRPASILGTPPTGNCGQCQWSAGRARSETRRIDKD